jgi:hypothetical protein
LFEVEHSIEGTSKTVKLYPPRKLAPSWAAKEKSFRPKAFSEVGGVLGGPTTTAAQAPQGRENGSARFFSARLILSDEWLREALTICSSRRPCRLLQPPPDTLALPPCCRSTASEKRVNNTAAASLTGAHSTSIICCCVSLESHNMTCASATLKAPRSISRRKSFWNKSLSCDSGGLRVDAHFYFFHDLLLNSSSSAFASFRSRVSNPSVNHP